MNGHVRFSQPPYEVRATLTTKDEETEAQGGHLVHSRPVTQPARGEARLGPRSAPDQG